MSVLFKTPWLTPDIEAVKSLTFMHCVIYGSLQVGHNSRHLNTEWLMVLHWKLTRRMTAFLNAALWMEGKPTIMNQQYCQPGDGSFLPEEFHAALKGTWILCLQSIALHWNYNFFFTRQCQMDVFLKDSTRECQGQSYNTYSFRKTTSFLYSCSQPLVVWLWPRVQKLLVLALTFDWIT